MRRSIPDVIFLPVLAVLVASCSAAPPQTTSEPELSLPPSPSQPEPTDTVSSGMATLISKWATEEAGATPTIRPTRPPPTRFPTPAPDLTSLEGTFTRRGIADKIAYIQTILHTPTRILYRNESPGTLADYGDFTHDVPFSILLEYDDPGITFEITSNSGPFVPSESNKGLLSICLSQEIGYGYARDIAIHAVSTIPQQNLLYRDLSHATGLSNDRIISLLAQEEKCLTLTVTLPVPALLKTDGLRVADFTSQSETCHLPCWNELTPGLSTELDIPMFFERLGVAMPDLSADRLEGEYGAYLARYPVTFPTLPPYVRVKVTDGTVAFIEVADLDYYDFLTFRHLFEALGPPDDIGIRNWGGQGIQFYDLLLHYSSINTAIRVPGETEYGQEAVCNEEKSNLTVTVVMYSDESDSYLTRLFLPQNDLSQAAGRSIEELTAQLSQPGGCVPFPRTPEFVNS